MREENGQGRTGEHRSVVRVSSELGVVLVASKSRVLFRASARDLDAERRERRTHPGAVVSEAGLGLASRAVHNRRFAAGGRQFLSSFPADTPTHLPPSCTCPDHSSHSCTSGSRQDLEAICGGEGVVALKDCGLGEAMDVGEAKRLLAVCDGAPEVGSREWGRRGLRRRW